MLYCPRCSTRLIQHKCKLVCPKCGYYLSCADYYSKELATDAHRCTQIKRHWRPGVLSVSVCAYLWLLLERCHE